jgi:hypothetical protein
VIDWNALAAIGTVAAFFVGFGSLVYEWRDRRRRDRRSQATKVAGWIHALMRDLDRADIRVRNSSDEPVYRLIAWVVAVQGAAHSTGEEAARLALSRPEGWGMLGPGAMLVVPPGTTNTLTAGPWFGSDMHKRPGLEIAFTDANGVHWIRRATGELEETRQDAEHHYGLPNPGVW